jgi:hypothetical protein
MNMNNSEESLEDRRDADLLRADRFEDEAWLRKIEEQEIITDTTSNGIIQPQDV